MPIRPRWKIECERLAKQSIAIAYEALREMGTGTSRYEQLFAKSLALMKQSKALEDANKPPPRSPLLD
eukprot:1238443-Pleurochrysis_carterae.AAC.1